MLTHPARDLIALLHIVKHPGITLDGLAMEMGLTRRHAGRSCSRLESSSRIIRTKVDGSDEFHVRSDDPITGSLIELMRVMDESRIITLLGMERILMLISAVASGADTIEMLIHTLKSSRSSVYRSIDSFQEEIHGGIIRDGKRSTLLRLNMDIPSLRPIVQIATILHPFDISDRTGDRALSEISTVRSRILLHLYLNPHTGDIYKAPVESTQRFITGILRTSQPVISRELKDLSEKGYIGKTRSRVPGSKKRENTYHLTEKGSSAGKDLLELAETIIVDVIDHQGVQAKVPLTDVPKIMRARIDLGEILYHAGRGSPLVIERMAKEAEAYREMDFIKGLRGTSTPDDFFGRNKEKEQYRKWLEGNDGMLIVFGDPGMGKTTFVSQMLKESSPGYLTFVHTLNELSTPGSFLKHLSLYLKESGACPDQVCHVPKGASVLREQEVMFERTVQGSKIVICLDDSHKIGPMMKRFLQRMLSLSGPDLKIVMTGRHPPEGLDLPNGCHRIPLEGLDRDSSRSLLQLTGGPTDDVDRIHELTGGNPLAIKLIACMDTRDYNDLGSLIDREMMPNLSIRDIEILNFLSVLRYPFPAAILKYAHREDVIRPSWRMDRYVRKMEELSSRSILAHSGDLYRMHDIIRNLFLKMMDGPTRARAHDTACRYYLELENDPARIEALHHLLSVGDTIGAMKHISDFGGSLVKRGYAEELLSILSLIDPLSIDKDLIPEYHHLYGEIQHVMGDWNGAMESFRKAVRTCDELELHEKKTRSNIMIARLLMLRGSSPEAIEMFSRTLDLARNNHQFMQESYAVRQLGSIYYLMGENELAKECHERSLEIARITRSRECLANAYFLGSLLKKLDGDSEGCESEMRAAMAIYDELGDTIQKLKLVNNLGWLYSQQERWEESLELMEEVLDLATSSSDLENIGYGLLNSADILIQLKRYDEARERLVKAGKLFRQLEDMRLISSTEFTFAQLHTAVGEWDDAARHYDRSIEGYEKLGVINQLPELYHHYADMESVRGNVPRAKQLYEVGLKYAKRMKDSPWVQRIQEKISGLHKD